MLVSHRKKFIFLKTEKTAGSSLEVYLERFCMPEGEYEFESPRDEYVNEETGIIGARGGSYSKYYGHMSAKKVKKELGSRVWNKYLKITSIRNPYEKVVSYFHHIDEILGERRLKNMNWKRVVKYIIWKLTIPLNEGHIERFKRWVCREKLLDRISFGVYPSFVIDRNRYLINEKLCVDYVINTSTIKTDLKELCNILKIDYDPERLPERKSDRRPNIPTKKYYNEEIKEIVKEFYEYEFERWGFDLS